PAGHVRAQHGSHAPENWLSAQSSALRTFVSNYPMAIQDSFLSGANIDFIEGLYARWLEDPNSVDASWRELFQRSGGSGQALTVDRPATNGHPLQPTVRRGG